MGIMITIMYKRGGGNKKGIGGLVGGTEMKSWSGYSGKQIFYRMPFEH